MKRALLWSMLIVLPLVFAAQGCETKTETKAPTVPVTPGKFDQKSHSDRVDAAVQKK